MARVLTVDAAWLLLEAQLSTSRTTRTGLASF